MNIEYIGYIASFLVVISFLFKDIFYLRLINIVGSLFFIAYGILLSTSWPIIITNTFLICINFYSLFKIRYNKSDK